MEKLERPQTVAGLRWKRERLLIHLRRLDVERDETVLALRCLDGAIDLFVSPKIDTGRYAPVDRDDKSLFLTFLGDYLRTSPEPVSAGEAALAWLKYTGQQSTKESRNGARVRIRLKFETLVKSGVLEEVETGGYKHWQLIR